MAMAARIDSDVRRVFGSCSMISDLLVPMGGPKSQSLCVTIEDGGLSLVLVGYAGSITLAGAIAGFMPYSCVPAAGARFASNERIARESVASGLLNGNVLETHVPGGRSLRSPLRDRLDPRAVQYHPAKVCLCMYR
jgi:hypothetical protein